jgi:hypothetical protein
MNFEGSNRSLEVDEEDDVGFWGYRRREALGFLVSRGEEMIASIRVNNHVT